MVSFEAIISLLPRIFSSYLPRFFPCHECFFASATIFSSLPPRFFPLFCHHFFFFSRSIKIFLALNPASPSSHRCLFHGSLHFSSQPSKAPFVSPQPLPCLLPLFLPRPHLSVLPPLFIFHDVPRLLSAAALLFRLQKGLDISISPP